METSERDEVKLLFDGGLSLFTLARISGVPSDHLCSCANDHYCIRYVGHAILQVVQMRSKFNKHDNWPELFANYIEAHTNDPSLGLLLAAEIRLYWAVQQIQSSSI